MRKSWLIACVAIVVVAGGVVGWRVRHRRPSALAKIVSAPAVFEGPDVTLNGRIEAQSTEQVDAPVAGVLQAWFVEEGQEVYEDQLVGRIQNADLDSAVQKAQAAFDQAGLRVASIDAETVSAKLEVSRATADQVRAHNELDRIDKIYQRYKKLMDADAIARLTFEKTESDYKAAKAEAASRDAASDEARKKAADLDRDAADAERAVTEATAALAKAKDAMAVCELHSPADGVVLTRNVHQGEAVEESAKALMTIATDLTNLRVVVAPGALALARIRAGQHAFVHVADAELPGEVKETRGADVVVDFTSPTPITKLGTAAQVRIVF